MKVSIEIQGEEKHKFALAGVAAALSDFRKVDRSVSDEIYSIVRKQFATEGGRAGRRWPGRSAAYLESVSGANRQGFKVLGLPLRASDALFLAVTTRGAPHGIYDATEDSLTLGTTLPYAIVHQEGRGRIPQRRIYDLTERDVKDIRRVIVRAYKKPIEDRGFDYKESSEIPF